MNPMTTEWMEARISALEAEGMTRSDAQAVVEAEMLEAQRSMEWTLIHSYTRKQAIEDGVLVDVSAAAFGVGFKVHVAMTPPLMPRPMKQGWPTRAKESACSPSCAR